MVTNLTGSWAFATFGFIALAMGTFPFILYFFGAHLRAHSRFSAKGGMSFVQMEMTSRQEGAAPMKNGSV